MVLSFLFGASLVALIALLIPGNPPSETSWTQGRRLAAVGNTSMQHEQQELDDIIIRVDVLTQAGAFECFVMLTVGAIAGYCGVLVAHKGREREIWHDHIDNPSYSWQQLLSRMPSTVSENIHDTTSSRGTAFKALMLVLALMLLVSNFPRYEYYPAVKKDSYVSWSWWTFYALRAITPSCGIIMLIFIPCNQQILLLMNEKFQNPDYQLTEKDKFEFMSSELQDNLHKVGGFIGMGLTAMFELFNLTYLVVHIFFGDETISMSTNQIAVSWGDSTCSHTSVGGCCSYMWLGIAIARIIVLLAIFPTLARYVYETGMQPEQRCRWRNPDYSYVPEKNCIVQLTFYVLLTGMSMLFVNRRAFDSAPVQSQCVLLIIASIEILLTLYVVFVYHLWFLLRIHHILGEDVMRERMDVILKKYEQKTQDDSALVQRLEKLVERSQLRNLAPGKDDDYQDDNSDAVSSDDPILFS